MIAACPAISACRAFAGRAALSKVGETRCLTIMSAQYCTTSRVAGVSRRYFVSSALVREALLLYSQAESQARLRFPARRPIC